MSEPAHIIIIEDDEGSRAAYTRYLSRLGHKVADFPEADPALDHLRSHGGVALVITDLMLPGTDGFGVLRAARQIHADVGVLMITGHASVESAVDGLKFGAFDYVMKPIDIPDLLVKIEEGYEKKKEHNEKIRAAKVSEIISHPMTVFSDNPED